MRIPSAVVMFALAAGCAPAVKETRPEQRSLSNSDLNAMAAASMAEAQKMMLEMRAAQDDATRACEPQRSRVPTWAEERAVGADLAVSLTAQNGHLYLEGTTEMDPAKLQKDLEERRSIVLPEGKKNAVSAHVAIVGRHLARYSSRPDLPWVFGVIQNDTADTFSAPGGFVFVTTGLLKKLTNEAQLAGVLGHEISHVTRKDTLSKYVDAKYKQCIAAKTAAAMISHVSMANPALAETARFAREFDGELDLDKADGGLKKFILSAMMMLMMTGSDRTAELEHDKDALELLAFAGYDVVEYEKLVASTPMNKHPDGANRAVKLKSLREGELATFATGTAKPDLSELLAPLTAP